MSPRQVLVVPVTQTVYGYAEEVQRRLAQEVELYVDVDLSSDTLNKKVRRGEVGGYNFVIIVGHEEMEKRAVNVRNGHGTTGKGRDEAVSLDDVCERFRKLKESKSLENIL